MSATDIEIPAEECTPDQPTIILQDGQLPEIVDQACYVLASTDSGVYQRSGQLVVVVRDGRDDRQIKRAPGAPRIVALSPIAARDILTRHARWMRWDRRANDFREVDAPMSVAAALLERSTWGHIPELLGYVEAATMRADGSTLARPGYDSKTGLLLLDGAPDINLPDVVREDAGVDIDAARQEGEAAIELFREIYSSMPFVDAADMSAAIAAAMGAQFAPALPAVPQAAFTATTPATGKSMLQDAVATQATGRRAPVMSFGRDQAEAEKRLGAALLGGDQILAQDNLERPLEGDLQCQAITQPTLTIRPLGASSKVRVPSRVALMATGNNLVIKGDMNRRVLLIRLDAGCEAPEQRHFERDFLADVLAARAELIAAALTISRVYQIAGTPALPDLPAAGGFEDWDRLVRRPLVYLGLPDPLAPIRARRDDDPDRAAMRSLFSAWHSTYGDRPVTAAQVIDDASRSRPRFDGMGADYEHEALHEALLLILGERFSVRQFGYVLRRYRGKIADGLRMDHAGQTGKSKSHFWSVSPIGG